MSDCPKNRPVCMICEPVCCEIGKKRLEWLLANPLGVDKEKKGEK